MSILFEPVRINRLDIPNRFVRSATNDGGADPDGYVTDRQVALYDELARGGTGLIVTGAINVHPHGQILAFQKRIDTDGHIKGLARLTEAVHRHGKCIAVQLFHGGAEAGAYSAGKGWSAGAPSHLGEDSQFPFFKGEYRALDETEIASLITDFGQGARRAREAGFDAVQLHGAHGYLFSQFLSPYINRREDSWGGSLENRLRFTVEVYREIRRQVGEDYPVLIKLGVQDSFPDGLLFEEGRKAARLTAELGFDCLEISSGARGSGWKETEFRTGIRKVEEEAYYRLWCREIKPDVGVPLMLAGGLRSFELMEEIVRQGDAELVSLSRPLIREPNLVQSWKEGDLRRSACISCNKCIEQLVLGKMALCTQLEKSGKKPAS